jgi:hypothetical protein
MVPVVAFLFGVLLCWWLADRPYKMLHPTLLNSFTEREFLQLHPSRKWFAIIFAVSYFGGFLALVYLFTNEFGKTLSWVQPFCFPVLLFEGLEGIISVFEIASGWTIRVHLGKSLGGQTYYRKYSGGRRLGYTRLAIALMATLLCISALRSR